MKEVSYQADHPFKFVQAIYRVNMSNFGDSMYDGWIDWTPPFPTLPKIQCSDRIYSERSQYDRGRDLCNRIPGTRRADDRPDLVCVGSLEATPEQDKTRQTSLLLKIQNISRAAYEAKQAPHIRAPASLR